MCGAYNVHILYNIKYIYGDGCDCLRDDVYMYVCVFVQYGLHRWNSIKLNAKACLNVP